jgi:hypothetical protein
VVDLRPWRVPVAIILLAALALRLGAALARVAEAAVGGSGLLFAVASAGVGAGEVVLAVALAAVVWWCATDGVRGARVLAIVAFVLVALQIVLSVAASVASYLLAGGGAVARLVALVVPLTWLVVPALAAAVLLRSARAVPVVKPAVEPEPEPVAEREPAAEPEPVEQPYPEAAGWAPHEAAGAVWTRAGEAATGAAASGWGSTSGEGEEGWGSTDRESAGSPERRGPAAAPRTDGLPGPPSPPSRPAG